MKGHCKILRNLTTDTHDDSIALFLLVDIHDTLLGKFLKVQLVALVVVRADRLRVVVDHDTPLAHLLDRADRRHSAPVELDATADAISTISKHHYTALITIFDVGFCPMIGCVQVVGLSRVLCGQCLKIHKNLEWHTHEGCFWSQERMCASIKLAVVRHAHNR